MGNKQCKQNEITPDFVKKFVQCGASFLDDPCGPLKCLEPLKDVFDNAAAAIADNQGALSAHFDPDTVDEITVVGADGIDESINAMLSVANNMNEEGIGFFNFPAPAGAAANAKTSALALLTTFLVTSQGNYTNAAASINRTNLPQLFGNYSQGGLDNQIQKALDINEVLKMILFPSSITGIDEHEFLFVSTKNEDNKLMRGRLYDVINNRVISADECGPVLIPPGLYARTEKKKKKKNCGCGRQQQSASWPQQNQNQGCGCGFQQQNCECHEVENDCEPIVAGPKSDPFLLPFSLAGIDLFKSAKNPRDAFVSRFR